MLVRTKEEQGVSTMCFINIYIINIILDTCNSHCTHAYMCATMNLDYFYSIDFDIHVDTYPTMITSTNVEFDLSEKKIMYKKKHPESFDILFALMRC